MGHNWGVGCPQSTSVNIYLVFFQAVQLVTGGTRTQTQAVWLQSWACNQTLPALKRSLELQQEMCPKSFPPQPPTGPRTERDHRGSPGVALSRHPEKVLLSTHDMTRALRLNRKHKLAQVYLTNKWWLNQ